MQKQSRVDSCTFGTLALFDLRDTYLQSLAGKEPGPEHIPNLDPKVARLHTASPSSARSDERPPPPQPPERQIANGEIPLTQAVRTCAVARKLSQPPAPELDTELGRFEPFVTALHGQLVDAARYYQSKAYEQDGFERGRQSHAELTLGFGALEERWAAMRDATERWRAGAGRAPDPLDQEAQIAERAVVAARAAASMLVARAAPNGAAIEKVAQELARASIALEELSKRAPRSPYVRQVLPPVESLRRAIDAARAARTAVAAVPPAEARTVGRRYAGVVDQWNRALSRAFGVRGKRRGSSGRGLTPLRPGPKPSGDPTPASSSSPTTP